MAAYYNEIDPYAAQWLRNLIAAGHIAPGVVDHRPVQEVKANDLCGYAQCHFFAGIGGWSYALRLAGWPDDRKVWTGSCPCQPFSVAGQRGGFDDERHLWPHWFSLIRECRPPVVLGEQVAAAIGGGWLDAVLADLEGEDYACGSAVLPACGVGAPHIRQRVWFMADGKRTAQRDDPDGCVARDMADSTEPRRYGQPQWHAGTDGRPPQEPGRLRDTDILGDAERPRLQEQRRIGSLPSGTGTADTRQAAERAGTPADPWADCIWLPCTDGKARPAQPGVFPLAHGVPARMGKLRAAGNAIVPQIAAEFIKAQERFQPGQP